MILSLSAQVVEAEPSIIGWLAAALPALGFLAMVKMAMGRADPGAAVQHHGPLVPDQTATVPDQPLPDRDQPDSDQDRPDPSRTSADVTALLPAATTAAATLAAQGKPLNRASLSRQMRADGHSFSTDTATVLTRLLREQPPTPPADTDEAADELTEPVSAAA